MIKIVFKNDFFVILDKPANVLSVPSRMGENDERPCLGIMLEKELNKKIFPVHRLDFEVSGLIMYALTPESQRAANSWFENKVVFKTYEAITKSHEKLAFPINELLIWECTLMKGKKRAYEAQFGKKALTHATVVETLADGRHRWNLNPITGRSHQLRYELFRHGCPIIGDALYGSSEKYEFGIALRAFKIDFSNCLDRETFLLPIECKIFGL